MFWRNWDRRPPLREIPSEPSFIVEKLEGHIGTVQIIDTKKRGKFPFRSLNQSSGTSVWKLKLCHYLKSEMEEGFARFIPPGANSSAEPSLLKKGFPGLRIRNVISVASPQTVSRLLPQITQEGAQRSNVNDGGQIQRLRHCAENEAEPFFSTMDTGSEEWVGSFLLLCLLAFLSGLFLS